MTIQGWWALPMVIFTVAVNCGNGEATADATATCQDMRARQGQCMNDAAFAECVSCREECGRSCVQVQPSTCPLQFHCR